MYYEYGPMANHDWGWGVFMAVLWLIFFAFIALVVVRLLRYHDMTNHTGIEEGNSPKDIVKLRYAKGEINKSEYEQLLKDLK